MAGLGAEGVNSLPVPLAVGIDGWKSGWLGAVLLGDDLAFEYRSRLADFTRDFACAAAIVVDVPIGMPQAGRRAADIEAHRFVGARASSVFSVPPEEALRADSYREALAVCRERFGFGLSSQAYALREKIFEAEDLAGEEVRLIEGHPEVSFAALKCSSLGFAKRTWNGQQERRDLLRGAGLVIPDQLSPITGRAPADDVLDAAVMAWTARRVADGEAKSLPDPPETANQRQVAIWY